MTEPESRRFTYKLDPELAKSSQDSNSDVDIRPAFANQQMNPHLLRRNNVPMLTNKVYTPWYKRYAMLLPESEQLEFQPYEEIDKREEEIAMTFVYGDDWPSMCDDKMMRLLRREAVQKHTLYKERMTQRELREQGTELHHRMSLETTESGPSVTSLLADRVMFADKFEVQKMSDKEKKKVADIIGHVQGKRMQTKRQLLIQEMRANGWSVWHTNWKLLLKPKNKLLLAQMYKDEHKVKIRHRFRRIINLVFAVNRFLQVLAEISGDTLGIVKDIRHFQLQESMRRREKENRITKDEKFIFQPQNYQLFNDTPLSKSDLLTMTKPWYNRTIDEVELAIKSLQVLRCFAELPVNTQRIIAMVAWFITVPEDRVLIRQSHLAQDYYILLAGRVSKTILMGDVHGEKTSIFRHLHTYTKDEMLGEEAITNPGTQREYSATTCIKCDLLSMNVHDYFAYIMTPVNPRSYFPDHIRFICQCPFLQNVPKDKLIQEAENNITLAYFPPKKVVEFNMSDSLWVYVVWWGTCRTICEITPKGKVRPSCVKKSEIKPKQEIILMENRMTEPFRCDDYRKATDTDTYDSHKNLLHKTITKEFENLKNRPSKAYDNKDLRSIARKRAKIGPMLRAKRKQELRKNDETIIRSNEGKSEVKFSESTMNRAIALPPIETNATSSKNEKLQKCTLSSISSDNLDTSLPNIQPKLSFLEPDDDSGDTNDENKATRDISIRSSMQGFTTNSKYSLAGANLNFVNLIGNVKLKENIPSSKRGSFVENVHAALKCEWSSRLELFSDEKSEKSQNITIYEPPRKEQIVEGIHEGKSIELFSDEKSEKSQNIAIDEPPREEHIPTRFCEGNSEENNSYRHTSHTSSENSKKTQKSHLEMEEVFANPNIKGSRRRAVLSLLSSSTSSTEKHSFWKLKKKLVKGDAIGFEWVNLNDGKFRPEPEVPVLLSDGCELVMVRKSFLVDVLGKNGKRESL